MSYKNLVATIIFDDAKMFIYRDERNGKVYIGAREIVDYLKLNWRTQRNLLMDDEVLSNYCISVFLKDEFEVMNVHVYFEVRALSGWLYKINVNRLDDEARKRVLKFRKDCNYLILFLCNTDFRLND